MPTLSTGTRKTIQELSRVFNKLALELTSELTHAKAEIENLRREVQKLKSNPGKSSIPRQAKNQRASGRQPSHPAKKTSSSTTSQQRSSPSSVSSGPTPDASEYIFPREPFNPPAPPEPSPPSNN